MSGLFSPSALSLLAVNLGVIVFAVNDAWSLPTILASYLLQSVIIGIFQAKKMSDLKVFSTDGLKINNRAVEPTPATQRTVVIFFLLHYGVFHAAYAAFVLSEGRPYWPDVLLSGAAVFRQSSVFVCRQSKPRKHAHSEHRQHDVLPLRCASSRCMRLSCSGPSSPGFPGRRWACCGPQDGWPTAMHAIEHL